MKKVIDIINDKIIEAENCEDIDISQDYINGYINGLKMTLQIIKENNKINIKIKDIINLIKDTHTYFEIIEAKSGASFGIYSNKSTIQEYFLEKEVESINCQYINDTRIIIIRF